MGNYSPKFRCCHQKSSYRPHLDRHTRPASPCRIPFILSPVPTLPRTFRVAENYVFSGTRFFLLRIYASWSLSRLSTVPLPSRFKLTLSMSPIPQKLEQWSLVVHLRISPTRVTYIALKLKRTFLCMRSLPTYLHTYLHTYSVVVSFLKAFVKDSC